MALSSGGDFLAVSAPYEDSGDSGVGGNDGDNSSDTGAVYVFMSDGQGAWSHQAYVKASNTQASDYFGRSVALSGAGDTLAVGAQYEDSNALGIGGRPRRQLRQLRRRRLPLLSRLLGHLGRAAAFTACAPDRVLELTHAWIRAPDLRSSGSGAKVRPWPRRS